MKTKTWVPEIFYEDSSGGGSTLPFIHVPKEEKMPKLLFIFESRETGEFEPGSKGEDLPVTELNLHQYVDMDILKVGLTPEEYDKVRQVLKLLHLKEAYDLGSKITENVRNNFAN